LLFLLPYFIVGLYGFYFAFWAAFQIVVFMIIIVCFRYIIFHNQLLFAFVSLPFFALSLLTSVAIFSLSKSAVFLIALGVLLIAFSVFLSAERAIGKIKSE
jgi:hypothetical protein